MAIICQVDMHNAHKITFFDGTARISVKLGKPARQNRQIFLSGTLLNSATSDSGLQSLSDQKSLPLASRGGRISRLHTSSSEICEEVLQFTRCNDMLLVYDVHPENATDCFSLFDPCHRDITIEGSFAQFNCGSATQPATWKVAKSRLIRL
jgi:hypothetical protein